MGYEVQSQTFDLELPESYDGAFVKCSRDLSVQAFFDFQRLINADNTNSQQKALEQFGTEILVDWNLLRDGQPIPATAEGFMSLPQSVATVIIQAWTAAMREPPAPLGEPSNAGDTSGAA